MSLAKIVAGSTNPYNDKKLVTFLLRVPKIVWAEALTHKQLFKDCLYYQDSSLMYDAALCKNAASARAIPFKKELENLEEEPFLPLHYQKAHKGMQGNEYVSIDERSNNDVLWAHHREQSIKSAQELQERGVTKQLSNRLLHVHSYMTALVTGTEWENFFNLRCPRYHYSGKVYRSKEDVRKAFPTASITEQDFLEMNKSSAEIHIQQVAEAMWDEYNTFSYSKLQPGEWHLPLVNTKAVRNYVQDEKLDYHTTAAKVSVARAARGSYGKWEGKTIEEDIKLHDKLFIDRHESPFSHPCKCPTKYEYEELSDTKFRGAGSPRELGWYSEIHGFIPYRYMVERNM